MRYAPIREVEQKERAGPGMILAGLAAFSLAALLLAGDVKWYEMRRENRELEDLLAQKEAALAELKQDPVDLAGRAAALGMRSPEPGQIEILHLREN